MPSAGWRADRPDLYGTTTTGRNVAFSTRLAFIYTVGLSKGRPWGRGAGFCPVISESGTELQLEKAESLCRAIWDAVMIGRQKGWPARPAHSVVGMRKAARGGPCPVVPVPRG